MATKKKPATKAAVATAAQTEAIVAKVSAQKGPELVRRLTDLGISIGAEFAKLQGDVSKAYVELDELKITIQAKKDYVEQLHQIDVSATKIEELEQQIVDLEQQYKDKAAELEQARKREADEFDYNLKLRRREEADKYAQSLAGRDKTVSEREAAVQAAGEELVELRSFYEGYDEALAAAVDKAVKAAVAEVTRENDHAVALLKSQNDGQQQLAKHEIDTLKKAVETLTAREEKVNELVAKAMEQVTTMATKSFDSAGAQQALSALKETMGQMQGKANVR